MVGATVEERGFDLSLTVGGVGDLMEDARRLVPALDEYTLVEITPGLRPGSPDNGPIVGPTRVEGLVLATGHYRNGILLAPVTADEVVGLLDAGPDHPAGGRRRRTSHSRPSAPTASPAARGRGRSRPTDPCRGRPRYRRGHAPPMR